MQRSATVKPHERGAALLEFAIIAPVLLLLLLTSIDIGRLVRMSQLSTDVTRVAASMGLRGFTPAQALAVARSVDSGLNLDRVGIVFVTTVARRSAHNEAPWVVEQVYGGNLDGFESRIGSPGGPADIGDIPSLEPGMRFTAVEVAIPFRPLFNLVPNLYPEVVYDVTYF